MWFDNRYFLPLIHSQKIALLIKSIQNKLLYKKVKKRQQRA